MIARPDFPIYSLARTIGTWMLWVSLPSVFGWFAIKWVYKANEGKRPNWLGGLSTGFYTNKRWVGDTEDQPLL